MVSSLWDLMRLLDPFRLQKPMGPDDMPNPCDRPIKSMMVDVGNHDGVRAVIVSDDNNYGQDSFS